MSVKERNGSWQADVKLGDTRYRPTFETKPEAEAWELEARAAHKLGKPIPVPGGGQVKNAKVVTMEQLVEHVFKVHWKSKKAGEHLVKIATLYRDWVGPKAPAGEALTDAKVHEYVQWRMAEKRNASATINRHLSAVSTLARYAHKLKLIPERLEMPWQDEGQGRLRYFTESEVAEIDRTLRQWECEGTADLFIFLADTGLRLGEALTLEWRDIKGRSITVAPENAKNGESRTVTATPRVEALLELRMGIVPGPWANVSRRSLRGLWDRLRVHFSWMGDDTVIHTYRHTCASRLVAKGIDLYRVKTWMGHKSLTTTMRYAHLAPKHMEELADALAA